MIVQESPASKGETLEGVGAKENGMTTTEDTRQSKEIRGQSAELENLAAQDPWRRVDGRGALSMVH
jgi:hypothetical protein